MKEYLDAIWDQINHGDRMEKCRILDEAVQVTGLHRKALIRALRTPTRLTAGGKAGRPKRYGLEAAMALKTLWEASDRVCAKRLQPFLPELLADLERHGELVLEQDVRNHVSSMSAATNDRLLGPTPSGASETLLHHQARLPAQGLRPYPHLR